MFYLQKRDGVPTNFWNSMPHTLLPIENVVIINKNININIILIPFVCKTKIIFWKNNLLVKTYCSKNLKGIKNT